MANFMTQCSSRLILPLCLLINTICVLAFPAYADSKEWKVQSDEGSELCDAILERIKLIADPNDENSMCSFAAALSDERLVSANWQKSEVSEYKGLVYELFIYMKLGSLDYEKKLEQRGGKSLASSGDYASSLKRAEEFIAIGGTLYFLRQRLIEHMDASTTVQSADPQILAQLRYPKSSNSANLDSCPEMKKVEIPAAVTFFVNADLTAPEPSARFISDKVVGSIIKFDSGRAVFFGGTAGNIQISVEGEVTLSTICRITNNE